MSSEPFDRTPTAQSSDDDAEVKLTKVAETFSCLDLTSTYFLRYKTHHATRLNFVYSALWGSLEQILLITDGESERWVSRCYMSLPVNS